MIFIPGWTANILLLATAGRSIYQLRRLYRPNPATVLIVTFTGRRDPYVSLGFFVITLGCPAFIIRQQRYLPPPERHRV